MIQCERKTHKLLANKLENAKSLESIKCCISEWSGYRFWSKQKVGIKRKLNACYLLLVYLFSLFIFQLFFSFIIFFVYLALTFSSILPITANNLFLLLLFFSTTMKLDNYLKVGGSLIVDIDKVHAYLYKHFVLTFQYLNVAWHRHYLSVKYARTLEESIWKQIKCLKFIQQLILNHKNSGRMSACKIFELS